MTQIEVEIAIGEEALRLAKGELRERLTWTTWDSFAGRNVEHEETSEQYIRRVVRRAVENVKTRVVEESRN